MIDLELADWREATARMYLAPTDLAAFRAARDEMFSSHPQSPVAGGTAPEPLPYFAASGYQWEGELVAAGGGIDIDTGGEDGVVHYRRVGRLATPWGSLTLFWIAAYGGGLFLPFRDATAPTVTYGGGRYLCDTVKGTFGRGLTVRSSTRVRLDFDYAYNPSCAYDPRWACPLAPAENRLTVRIEAGEQYRS